LRYFHVELGGIAPWMWANFGEISPLQQRFTQQPDHWTLTLYEHDGEILVNNRLIEYRAGNVGLIVPGTRVEFPRLAAGQRACQLTFGLVRRKETVIIPAIYDLGARTETVREDFQQSMDWLHRSIMRGLACAFNTLWLMAKPPGSMQKSDLVYEAEAIIMARLHERIDIEKLAAELGLSHSHMLRLFREAHNSTIQEFIRTKRTDIARQMITQTDESLKAIATKVGIPDLQAFNKIIRVATGLSPRALRQQAKTKTLH
jgi:AraC-like DNA-binding protein